MHMMFCVQSRNMKYIAWMMQPSSSSLYYYLVHHFRRFRGPELVSAVSHVPEEGRVHQRHRKREEEVVSEAIGGLQAPPNLVLAFQTHHNSLFGDHLPARVPDNAVVLGAVSEKIQLHAECQIIS